MGVTIRMAGAADAAALAALRWRWEGDDRGPAPAEFLEFFADWVVTHLATHVPFVAEMDGVLVGSAWLVLADRVPSPTRPRRPTGDVQSVYVAPEYRDAGVGTAMMTALLSEARRRGLEHVTVHGNDRALPLYRRLGFTDTGHWLHLSSG